MKPPEWGGRKWAERVLSFETRFGLLVWPCGDCWEWRGLKDIGGYGSYTYHGHHHRAHHVSYEMAKGTIPRGLQIDHLCRHRWCVKPSHLEAVTQKVNILRGNGWAGIHARRTVCINGHPYTAENTVRHGAGRNCRACIANRSAQDYRKNKPARLKRNRAYYEAHKAEIIDQQREYKARRRARDAAK